MSVRIMAKVWAYSQRKDGELLVMLALADFANDAGESWPSLEVLAQKARLTKRQVCKVLDKLQAAGEIRRERSTGGRNRRTRYFINLNSRENSEQKTVLKKHCNKNSVFGDTKTVSYSSHALNRHRTVNKIESTESDKLIPDSLSTKEKGKRTRQAPDDRVKPFLTWFAGEYERRIGAPYAVKWAKEGKLIKELPPAFDLPRLKDLAARFFESPDPWVRQNGGFTVGVFISQINKLTSTGPGGNGNGQAKPVQVKDLGNGMLEVDGVQMDRRIYERRHGQHANA